MAVAPALLTAMKFDAGFSVDFDSFSACDAEIIEMLQLCKDQGLEKLMSTRIKINIPEIKEWVYSLSSSDESMTGTIGGEEKRSIQKPSPAGVAPILSESTRTVSVTPHLPEEGSSIPPITYSSALPSTPTVSLLLDSSTILHASPPTSPPPSHLARISHPSFDLLVSENLPTPPQSPISHPDHIDLPASTHQSPVHNISHHETTVPDVLPSTVLPPSTSFEITPAFIANILELITPSIKTMIEKAIAPLISTISSLTSSIIALSKTAESSSVTGLTSVSTEIRQGEMFEEDASGLLLVTLPADIQAKIQKETAVPVDITICSVVQAPVQRPSDIIMEAEFAFKEHEQPHNPEILAILSSSSESVKWRNALSRRWDYCAEMERARQNQQNGERRRKHEDQQCG
ncbi:hypothetical protein KSP39_PZI001949 [Platanthera zijinensis]|uniref:Uncharacterized protein n=1 Tax=Platanthera zijinensis TaxID=2320716 RepID=A0AAP0BZ95_9ASPA